MSWTLEAIRDLVGGTLAGVATREINGIAPLDNAGPDTISFLARADNEKYRQQLSRTSAAAVLLRPDSVEHCPVDSISVADPYLAYAQVSALFSDIPSPSPGVHDSAVVGQAVSLGEGVSIGANCVIGSKVSIGSNTVLGPNCSIGAGTSIGSNCRIAANVSVYHNIQIGSQVELHSNCVIGADGFGFAPSASGWKKIHQLGSVRIGDSVSVGASSTIDRGALEDTIIEDGVIIDNQVQIAHNVRIGKNTALAGCVGIAGSATIGANCSLGGGVGVAGHLNIVDNVHLTGMTLVSRSIEKAGVYSSGMVFAEAQSWKRNALRFLQLDKLHKRVSQLEKNSTGNH